MTGVISVIKDLRASTVKQAWALYVCAVASGIPTLWFYLVGEEGILVSSSLEMAQRGDWLRLWLYGTNAVHGVFANWLVILLAGWVGWEHAPGVVRAIMMVATACSGLIAAFVVQRLYRDAALTALAAAITVTFADILFYRGWLGYRDPLLGMLVFGAIAALWLAVAERRVAWLLGTLVFATGAFLTKGLIAYPFIGAAVLVFLGSREGRSFLLRPLPLLMAGATLCVPFAWAWWVGGDQSHNTRLTAEIADKLSPLGAWPYLKTLLTYPLETVLRLAPLSLLLLWWLVRRRAWGAVSADGHVRTALLIAVIAYVPFWLAPQSHFRYVLPVLPLLALAGAVVLWRLGENQTRVAMRWLWGAVALKLLAATVIFPMYQQRVRGENYALTARAVLQRTAGFTLYSDDTTAAGLSVTAYMNLQRLPQPVLMFSPAVWDSGFTISNYAVAPAGSSSKLAAQYPLGGDTLYLYCRGAACAAPVR